MLYGMVVSLFLDAGVYLCVFCCSKCVYFVCKLLCDIVWIRVGVFL